MIQLTDNFMNFSFQPLINEVVKSFLRYHIFELNSMYEKNLHFSHKTFFIYLLIPCELGQCRSSGKWLPITKYEFNFLVVYIFFVFFLLHCGGPSPTPVQTKFSFTVYFIEKTLLSAFDNVSFQVFEKNRVIKNFCRAELK